MSSHSFESLGSGGGDNNSGKKKRSKKKKQTTSNQTTASNSISSDDGFLFDSGQSRGERSSSNHSYDTFGSKDHNNNDDRKHRRGTRPKDKQQQQTPPSNNGTPTQRRTRTRTRSPKKDKKEGKPLKKSGNPSFSSDGTFSEDLDDDYDAAPNSDTEVKIVSKKFDDVYQRGRKLGLGAFAVVFIGTHRPTGAEYAVKQIDRSTMFWGDRDALQDEIVNLKMARAGPNIVQLYEVYEEKAFCYLIMEVMEGGELLECIIEKKTTFTEKESRSAVRCVLRALAYLHSNRVAHRDIKPENLLLSDPYNKDLNTLKLADFSFARQVQKRNECRTLCGTPGYLSPEMLERFPAYDVKCDVWSVGCLLFLLLGGFLPFDDEDDEVVFDLTREGRFEFRPEFWNSVSQSAKDLVTRMLTVNPKKRISAARALQSHWIEHGDEAFEERQTQAKNIKNLIEGKRKLKTAITTVRSVACYQQRATKQSCCSCGCCSSEFIPFAILAYPVYCYYFCSHNAYLIRSRCIWKYYLIPADQSQSCEHAQQRFQRIPRKTKGAEPCQQAQ